MTEVFLYNIQGAKAAKIKMLCHKLHIGARVIAPEDYGKKLSALLGLSDGGCAQDAEPFTEEMLYLVDLPGAVFDIFLRELRRQKLGVALKAVKTETNLGFTSCELYREIAAERAAIEANAAARHDA